MENILNLYAEHNNREFSTNHHNLVVDEVQNCRYPVLLKYLHALTINLIGPHGQYSMYITMF
jgi:hypothetical protein